MDSRYVKVYTCVLTKPVYTSWRLTLGIFITPLLHAPIISTVFPVAPSIPWRQNAQYGGHSLSTTMEE